MIESKSGKRQFLWAIGLISAFVQISIWLISDYFGYLISLLLIGLSFSVLLIAGIAEIIEKSRLPYWFFPSLIILAVISLLTFIFMGSINGFEFDWQSR